MEPTPPVPYPSGGFPPPDRTGFGPVADQLPSHPASVEDALVQVLLRKGLLSSDQIRMAQLYGQQNHRDFRQSILELNLLTPDRINELAFEHLAAMAGGGANGGQPPGIAGKPAAPISPDRAQQQRDVRKDLQELSTTATMPDLVQQILSKACDSRATDIHFDPQENGMRIRYRIDGQLQDILFLEPGMAIPVASRIKVMSNLNIVERRHSQDGRITIQHQQRPRDLRVATLPTACGEKLVIRIHEVMTDVKGFTNLGMTQQQAELLDRLISQPYGSVLVAGPVGAGKTSTLYHCLERVNSPARNVVTIEDPLEHRIAGVNQTQVSPEMGFTDGLRALLRQDPDVVMIGEIRDEETARIGIRAGLTGVLVFSTLHAPDAPTTISNLYNFGIPGYQLSSSLLAIVSQRLIRKICPYCRVTMPAEPKVLKSLDLDPDEHKDLRLNRGLGCPACFQTGYMGRTGVFEIMEIGEEIRDLIFQQIPKDILRRVAVDLGMRTLKQSSVDKILDGTTSVEEVYRVVAM